MPCSTCTCTCTDPARCDRAGLCQAFAFAAAPVRAEMLRQCAASGQMDDCQVEQHRAAGELPEPHTTLAELRGVLRPDQLLPREGDADRVGPDDFVEHTHREYGPGFFCTPDVHARLTGAGGMPAVATEQPKLAVWFGPMPESNGKANWTAILHRGDISEGFTIERSEHHDRVRYEADRVRHLVGELPQPPDILAYDADMLSPEGWQHPCGVPGTDTRTCTCHPDDNPPRPCPRKFALTECRAAAAGVMAALAPDDAWVAQVVSSGPAADLPLLEWRSADVSLNTPIGTKLVVAPGVPSCRAEQRGMSEWVCDCKRPGPDCKPTGVRCHRTSGVQGTAPCPECSDGHPGLIDASGFGDLVTCEECKGTGRVPDGVGAPGEGQP